MGGSLGQSVTLANSIIGVGILAMPFCFQQCGAVLAVLMLLVSGLVSRLTCYFLLKSAIMARRRNFEFLAFHVFGAPGKLLVEVGIIGFLMGTCIAYFVVVGDLGPQIICKMFNINQSDVLRTSVMVIVSLVCVLPLGLLRNVDSLSNVSAATIGFYFCLVIKIIAEAASQLYSGTGRSKMELWKPEGILQCVPIFSMALFCQTQLFEIFETLPVLSLEKMNVVTKNAINICTSVYVMVGLFGYIAFCTQSISGNILVSLSPTMASDVIKLGFVMSLAFSFPLIIFPCRASLYSLLYRKVLPSHHDHIINHSIPEGTFRCITVGIIAISLLVSLMIPNIELVLGLVGSTIGVMVCVVFPAACFVNVTVKNTNERVLAKMVLCLGIVVMVLGTYANLQAAETKLEHYDERYITQDRIDKIVKDFFETNKYSKQSEDAILKPETKTGHEIIEDQKSKVLEANIVKDSAVQPPNPVAPVPQSNEKHPTDTDLKFLAKVVDDIPKEEKPAKLKSSNEVKDKGKLDGDIEGGGDEESVINKVDDKKAEGENKSKYVIKDATKDETVDKIVAQSVVNQNNLEMLKQQALIDTIKQHGQEQQELIKEQKEILDELKKTKLEIEKNKKENIDKEQAKKLAVESIQKIANIAIQSLGGVTDKPIEESKFKIENNDGNKINELIKSPLQSASIGDLPEKAKLTQKTDIINQEQANDKKAPFEVIIKNVDEVINKLEEISHQDADNMNNNIANNVAAPSAKGNSVADDVQKNKLHVHSPDEPNSYVRGEDLEKVKHENKLSPSSLDALIKNVPVPMVMNQNYQNVGNFVEPNDDKNVEPQMQRNSNQNNEKPVVEEAVKSNQIHSREKREITCTDKSFRNEGNRKICKNIKELNEINENGIDIMISQKLSVPDEINLGKVDLVDQPSMDKNMIHQIRGLKSINETEPS